MRDYQLERLYAGIEAEEFHTRRGPRYRLTWNGIVVDDANGAGFYTPEKGS
jgi:hypothetical protein